MWRRLNPDVYRELLQMGEGIARAFGHRDPHEFAMQTLQKAIAIWCSKRGSLAALFRMRAIWDVRRAVGVGNREVHSENFDALLPSPESPAETAMRNEAYRVLEREKQRLMPMERAVLDFWLDGRSHAETAVVLGITEQASRNRLLRVIQKLRRMFTDRGILRETIWG